MDTLTRVLLAKNCDIADAFYDLTAKNLVLQGGNVSCYYSDIYKQILTVNTTGFSLHCYYNFVY